MRDPVPRLAWKREDAVKPRTSREEAIIRRIDNHPPKVTGLLLEWAQGERDALERLIPLVHRELHQIARRCMAGERPEHSLQATALVNEAYLRLKGGRAAVCCDRAHFLAVSARVMRRILVDHARSRPYQKRGGQATRVALDEQVVVSSEPPQDFVALDEALAALARFDERKSCVVELRFFGGLSIEETAAVLEVSPDTVMRGDAEGTTEEAFNLSAVISQGR